MYPNFTSLGYQFYLPHFYIVNVPHFMQKYSNFCNCTLSVYLSVSMSSLYILNKCPFFKTSGVDVMYLKCTTYWYIFWCISLLYSKDTTFFVNVPHFLGYTYNLAMLNPNPYINVHIFPSACQSIQPISGNKIT